MNAPDDAILRLGERKSMAFKLDGDAVSRMKGSPEISGGRRAGTAALRDAAASAATRAPGVSAWSVGMHVHHCCLSTIAVCRSLCASRPPVPARKFSPVRELIFLTGRIPRGRGTSPDGVLPRDDMPATELLLVLDEADRQRELARQAPSDAWFEHFAFGPMNRDRTLKFLEIHDAHHARIVADILAASDSSNSG